MVDSIFTKAIDYVKRCPKCNGRGVLYLKIRNGSVYFVISHELDDGGIKLCTFKTRYKFEIDYNNDSLLEELRKAKEIDIEKWTEYITQEYAIEKETVSRYLKEQKEAGYITIENNIIKFVKK